MANPNVISWVSFLICHWRHSINFHSLTNCIMSWPLEAAKRLGVHVVFLEVGIGICAKNCLQNVSNGMNYPCKTLWNFFHLNWNLNPAYSPCYFIITFNLHKTFGVPIETWSFHIQFIDYCELMWICEADLFLWTLISFGLQFLHLFSASSISQDTNLKFNKLWPTLSYD